MEVMEKNIIDGFYNEAIAQIAVNFCSMKARNKSIVVRLIPLPNDEFARIAAVLKLLQMKFEQHNINKSYVCFELGSKEVKYIRADIVHAAPCYNAFDVFLQSN